MTTKPDFSKETLDGQASEIGPGAWVLGIDHTAGGLKNLKLNNRVFAFKLKLTKDLLGSEHKVGDDVLFLYGLGDERTVDGVKKLELQTNLKAVAMLNNGGNHHIFLKFWYKSFPNMKIWLCPTRAHHTLNQQELYKDYQDRWELADNTTTEHHVQQLLDYFGSSDNLQVDCILFNQLFVHADHHGGWRCCDEKESNQPQLLGNMDFFSFMPKLAPQDSASDEPVFYYKPLKLIITGHHWEFIYRPKGFVDPPEVQLTGGWVWAVLLPKLLMADNRYRSGFQNDGGQRLRDPAVHAAQWREVMEWDFEFGTGHHDPPTVCGPIDNVEIMDGKTGGIKGHMKRELESSGELNNDPRPGSWWPWQSKNALQNAIDNEPKYVKDFGEPEVLRFGGPKYGPDGLLL